MMAKRCPKCSDELKVKGNDVICKSAFKGECDYLGKTSTVKSSRLEFDAKLIRLKKSVWLVKSRFGTLELSREVEDYLEEMVK